MESDFSEFERLNVSLNDDLPWQETKKMADNMPI